MSREAELSRLKPAAQLAGLAKGVRERRQKAARFARLRGAPLRGEVYVMAKAMTRKTTTKANSPASPTAAQRLVRVNGRMRGRPPAGAVRE